MIYLTILQGSSLYLFISEDEREKKDGGGEEKYI
jgi:hypothetical protein